MGVHDGDVAFMVFFVMMEEGTPVHLEGCIS